MENVPRLMRFRKGKVFDDFVETLEREGYHVKHEIAFAPDYGVPQQRSRLVLLASLCKGLTLERPTHSSSGYETVGNAIGGLPGLVAGGCDARDPLHRCSRLSPLNLDRIRASAAGGSWRDWDDGLVSGCHRKEAGRGYGSVYGRMRWDGPAPTITTQFYGFGNGRFGHPEQDRALSLREGAVLQSFPSNYDFVEPGARTVQDPRTNDRERRAGPPRPSHRPVHPLPSRESCPVSAGQESFRLTISLNVLEHLGINLYSNVPAVLSEIVANAWDADASEVRVTWNRAADRIVIQDDGIGMTPDEINERFLSVGYRRRDGQPGTTDKGRHPMGRKGIGKLSLFSIANAVRIETIKEDVKSAFEMKFGKIREQIRREGGSGTYEPTILPVDGVDFSRGTKITFGELRRRQTIGTTSALKKRVARRFSIVGKKHGFRVYVDGDEVSPSDRDHYDKIRYLWTYGDQGDVIALCPKAENEEDRTGNVGSDGITITGWLATVERVGYLKDEEGDNLNRIAIFIRGKLAQEDILTDFGERGVYASYLIGELRVDGLDEYDGPGTNEDEDAATSSRQKIVEDDERYQKLRKIIDGELKYIQRRWAELRSEEGSKKALEIPEVRVGTPGARGGPTHRRVRARAGRGTAAMPLAVSRSGRPSPERIEPRRVSLAGSPPRVSPAARAAPPAAMSVLVGSEALFSWTYRAVADIMAPASVAGPHPR